MLVVGFELKSDVKRRFDVNLIKQSYETFIVIKGVNLFQFKLRNVFIKENQGLTTQLGTKRRFFNEVFVNVGNFRAEFADSSHPKFSCPGF